MYLIQYNLKIFGTPFFENHKLMNIRTNKEKVPESNNQLIVNEELSKIIKNSNMFYITYNHISNNNMSADEFENFASKDFYICREEEVRDSHTNIIMYGYNRDSFAE